MYMPTNARPTSRNRRRLPTTGPSLSILGMATDNTFGRRLAELRERAGMSQRELAVATGLDQNTISRMERGTMTNPSWSTLAAFASAFGVSVYEVLPEQVATPGEEPATPRPKPYRAYLEFLDTPAGKTADPEELEWLQSVRLPGGMEPGRERFYITLLMLYRGDVVGRREGARSA